MKDKNQHPRLPQAIYFLFGAQAIAKVLILCVAILIRTNPNRNLISEAIAIFGQLGL
ncbi:MAG: hypothetical protein F6K10_19830 [Moorea sp. SIO2B7]|nr:hypothetical protein [Moorena sp. SIO2B7]